MLTFILYCLQCLRVNRCSTECCARFNTGRQSTDDGIRVEAPRTAITDQNIRQAGMCIIADRRVMVREIAEKLSLSFGSVETVIHEHLKFFQVSLRWAPKQLTKEHKQHRIDACQSLVTQYCEEQNEFLSGVITCDGT